MRQAGHTASVHPDATTTRSRGGLIALAAAALAFAILLVWQWFTLPDRVPGHIGPDGQVTWWGTRADHVLLGALMGLGVALLFLVPVWLVDKLPTSMVNLPHKEYWTRAENWPVARRMLAEDLAWLGAATLAFMAVVWWQVGPVASGTEGSWWPFWVVTGIYLVGLLGYAIWMHVGPRWRPPTA